MLVGAFEMRRISPELPCFDLGLRHWYQCLVVLPSEVLVGDDDTANFFFIRYTGLAGFPHLWNPLGTSFLSVFQFIFRWPFFLCW